MRRLAAGAIAAWLGLAGCASPPKPTPADLLAPRGASAAAIQERRFDGVSAPELAQAVVQVLQDASFLVTASEPALGLIIATRGASPKGPGELTADMLREIGLILIDPRAIGELYLAYFKQPFGADAATRAKYAAKLASASSNAVVFITPAASGSAVRITFHTSLLMPYEGPPWLQEVPGPEPHQKFFALLAAALRQ